MQVILAKSLGLCFGVRDALALAKSTAEPESTTIRGELVHNEIVLHELDLRGFHRADERDAAAIPGTPLVMITAHGISDRQRGQLEEAGKRLIDTTCPLVRRVHRAAQTLAAQGRHVVVIGRPNHVEVRGVVEDLANYSVVDAPETVERYPHDRLGVICQSTTPPRLAQEILAAIRAQNPQADIQFTDTICQPTRDRQESLEQLLPKVDAVVVVGGRNSNNTRELVALCRSAGRRVYHVQSSQDLDREWFRDCDAIGLTAGTSTLDETIEDVRRALTNMD